MITVRALALWIRRDVDAPAGARTFASPPGSVAMPIAFVIASLIELVVLHLVIPWGWLRWVVAGLTVLSLLPLFGWIAAQRVYPHALIDGRLLIRSGGRLVAEMPAVDVAAVLPRRRFSPTVGEITDSTLSVPTGDGTNVEIELRHPLAATLGGVLPGSSRSGDVATVRLHVDHPDELSAALTAVPTDTPQR